MVQAECNGLGELLSLRIDPDLFGKGDREMIEDLVPAAVNDAAVSAGNTFTRGTSAAGAGG